MSRNISFGLYRSKESTNFFEIKKETDRRARRKFEKQKRKRRRRRKATRVAYLSRWRSTILSLFSFLFSCDQYLSRMRVMNADGELIELRYFPFFSSLFDDRSILPHAISAQHVDESAYQLVCTSTINGRQTTTRKFSRCYLSLVYC